MQNFNKIKNVLTKKEADDFKNIFLKNTPTLSNLGDKCYGIDINNTASYLWFKKFFFSKIQTYFEEDMKLIFAFYSSFTKPFAIHTDLKPLPNNATGRPFVSCLIPVSVDNRPENCSLASTVFFRSDTSSVSEQDRMKHLSHCQPVQLENKQIDEIINWSPLDMIWWKSELDHCSSHFNNFKTKECFVIHTYVE